MESASLLRDRSTLLKAPFLGISRIVLISESYIDSEDFLSFFLSLCLSLSLPSLFISVCLTVSLFLSFSGVNQTARCRRFELFPDLETISSRSTDVLPTDWKIRKFDVCAEEANIGTGWDRETTTIG